MQKTTSSSTSTGMMDNTPSKNEVFSTSNYVSKETTILDVSATATPGAATQIASSSQMTAMMTTDQGITTTITTFKSTTTKENTSERTRGTTPEETTSKATTSMKIISPTEDKTSKQTTTMKMITMGSTAEQGTTTMKMITMGSKAEQGTTTMKMIPPRSSTEQGTATTMTAGEKTSTMKKTSQGSTTVNSTPSKKMITGQGTTTKTKKGCKCGIEAPQRRIAGGKEVIPMNKYPWLVAIFEKDKKDHLCGGTLVASKFVITTAHCMWKFEDKDGKLLAKEKRKPTEIRIRIGDHDLEKEDEIEPKPMTVEVELITIHEKYLQKQNEITANGGGHDIAILELKETLDPNVYTPACLAKSTDKNTFDGKKALIVGWGNTDEKGTKPNSILPREVEVTVLQDCGDVEKPGDNGDNVKDNDLTEMCTQNPDGKGFCLGDNGGPLTYISEKQHVLIGVASHWKGECQKPDSSVFCRISAVRDWIDTHIKSEFFCSDGGANAA